MKIKASIIIAIYNSHEAVRRQIKYFNQMQLSDDIEFIFVDDGSEPPLDKNVGTLKNLSTLFTNDKRPWTQGLARNLGAAIAKGKYLFFTDIDHIISREAINDVLNFTGDKMMFPREFGILTPEGELSQDILILEEYGLDLNRTLGKRGLYASYHGNTYAIKKSTFDLLGGYDPKHCQYGHHAPSKKGEDGAFNHQWNRWAEKEGIKPAIGSKIYMFPVGRYHINRDLNPLGLFHNLSQEQVIQPMKGEEI